MRKKSIAIIMALTFSMTGYGNIYNVSAASGGARIAAEVKLQDSTQTDTGIVTDTTQKEELAGSYPKITTTGYGKTYRSKNKKQDYCYFNMENVAVDKEKYPELAAGIKRWNTKNKSGLQKQALCFVADCKELMKYNSKHENEHFTYILSESIIQKRADSKVLSFQTDYEDYMGGAHGSHALEGITFDTATGKQLKLSNVIVNQKKFKTVAYNYLVKTVKRFYGDGLFGDYKKSIKKDLSNLNWTMTDYGLQIAFSEYDIAPYVAGVIKVDIPYSLIKDCMNAKYLPENNAPAMFEFAYGNTYQLNLDGSTKEVYLVTRNFNKKDNWDLSKASLMIGGKEHKLFTAKGPNGYFSAECTYLHNANGEDYFLLGLDGDGGMRRIMAYKRTKDTFAKTDTLDRELVKEAMHASGFDCKTAIHVFGTYSGVKTYTIDENGKFKTSDTIERIVNSIDSDIASVLTARKEVAVTIEGKETKLKAGTKIYPVGADDSKLYFQTEDKKNGWIGYDATVEGVQMIKGVEVTKLFKGIQYSC